MAGRILPLVTDPSPVDCLFTAVSMVDHLDLENTGSISITHVALYTFNFKDFNKFIVFKVINHLQKTSGSSKNVKLSDWDKTKATSFTVLSTGIVCQ